MWQHSLSRTLVDILCYVCSQLWWMQHFVTLGVLSPRSVGELSSPVSPAEDLAHPLVPLCVLQPSERQGQHH